MYLYLHQLNLYPINWNKKVRLLCDGSMNCGLLLKWYRVAASSKKLRIAIDAFQFLMILSLLVKIGIYSDRFSNSSGKLSSCLLSNNVG